MQNGQATYQANGVVPLEEYLNLKKAYSELEAELLYHKQELAQLKRMIFGSKSERYVPLNDGQLALKLGLPGVEQPAPQQEEITYKRNKPRKEEKKGHGRVVLPSNLLRKEVVIEPDFDVTGAKIIGKSETEVLDYIPSQFYVTKYTRYKYLFPETEKIVTPELPSLPIPKGNAGASVLAHVCVSKFIDHIPFYRQAKIYKRSGIEIPESTINDWFSATCNLLSPLYDKLIGQLIESPYLMVDETPIPVLSKNKPGSTHRGYYWVYYSPLSKIVCFDYRKGRGRDGPEKFLNKYKGTIQTDGYTAYDSFENKEGYTLLACMAHARRKFDQAKDNDPQRADYALNKIGQLYCIEDKARQDDLSHDQRKQLRREKSLPVRVELESWMKDQLNLVAPKSAIGKAIAYTLGLWKRLVRYIDDGRYEIDNNLVENTIRPVAIGYA